MYYKYTIKKYDLTQWKKNLYENLNYFLFLYAYFRHTPLLNFKYKNFIGKQIKINWLYHYCALFLVWKISFNYIYWVKSRRLKKSFDKNLSDRRKSLKSTYFDSCYPPWWSPETQASGCRVHSSSRGCSGPRGNNPRPRD